MQITFWGTRGSMPVLDPKMQKTGGNTTCIEVRIDEETIVIIDAGTGYVPLGTRLIKDYYGKKIPKIYLFMTHLHWDHLYGFPMCPLHFYKDATINVYAYTKKRTLEKVIEMMMDFQFSPVSHKDFFAHVRYIDIEEGSHHFENFTMTAVNHNHPGGALSYRLEANGKVFVLNTDAEHDISQLDDRIINISLDADLMVHDAQYTTDEIDKYIGWGHSTWEQAVEVAKIARVKKLGFIHHDPFRTDTQINALEKKAQKKFPDSFFCRDNMIVNL